MALLSFAATTSLPKIVAKTTQSTPSRKHILASLFHCYHRYNTGSSLRPFSTKETTTTTTMTTPTTSKNSFGIEIPMYTLEEIQQHHSKCNSQHKISNIDTVDGYYAVINSYVVDISQFFKDHPGGASKIIQTRNRLGVDITRNFLDHFSHTVQTFRQACQQFESTGKPVKFHFKERPNSSATILGRTD